MTKPKSYDYIVYFKDQTYQTFSLTRADVDAIGEAMDSRRTQAVAKLSIGYINTQDIRSIVEHKAPATSTPVESEEDLHPTLSLEDQAYIDQLLGTGGRR